MYGIFTYIYHKNQPNVGKYTIPMDAMGNERLPSFKLLEISGWRGAQAEEFDPVRCQDRSSLPNGSTAWFEKRGRMRKVLFLKDNYYHQTLKK